MLFTSYEFLLFLVTVIVLYYLIPVKYRWVLLLAASYIFYAFTGFLAYIVVTTLSTYIAGIKISSIHKEAASLSREEKKQRGAQFKKSRTIWFLACIIFNIGMLGTLKIMNSTVSGFILPLGISFYIFQSMGYIIDVNRGKYPAETHFFKFALFVSFFPQLIQGPISRFDDLSKTLYNEAPFNSKNVTFGVQRILWGYFKKLVIADTILIAVNQIIGNPETYQGSYVLIGMFFYAIRLYADFTGGIDITIGIAEVLGIRVKENFERPFFSKSISEYWRRWHITMGTWFRDYLFYPISVSKPMLNFSKYTRKKLGNGIGKRIPVYLSTLIVWFATGIWHGTGWNFITWGLMNGIVIIISQECTPFYEWFHSKFKVSGTFWFKLFQVARTFFLMCSLRIFDCYRDVGTAFKMYGTIFTQFDTNIFFDGSLLTLGLSIQEYLLLASGVALMICASLVGRRGQVREMLAEKPALLQYAACFALFLAIIIFGAYGTGYDANQFIYNQF